jgi:VIT1/CCC1 family predicted Fe2+/Mn2+ transporter
MDLTFDRMEAARYRRNLRDELDGAALYHALAQAESDPVRKDLFLQLSEAETKHAALWRSKLEALGIDVGVHVPTFRTRVLAMLAARFGPRYVLPSIAAAECADQNKYAGQSDALALSADERSHAAVVNAALGGGDKGDFSGALIAKAERWHRGGSGNELRASVLGANDGLVSNFCLIMGVAGAGSANHAILLTGLAGLVAGACSMALGEWLSVTNARELAQSQLSREAQELAETPEAEEHELALIFQAKGLDREHARQVAARLMKDQSAALDTLAREELGIDPAELGGNPWTAAGSSFALFAAGAIFPIVPFSFSQGLPAIGLSVALSAVGLAAIGVVTSLFNGRGPLFSAARQVVIGCAAAAVTYGAGLAFGVSVS